MAKQNTTRARFIPPMLLLRTERLPEGWNWLYELKLDGYRAIAPKAHGRVHLWSRNENDFAQRYPTIARALAPLPDERNDLQLPSRKKGKKPREYRKGNQQRLF